MLSLTAVVNGVNRVQGLGPELNASRPIRQAVPARFGEPKPRT